MTVVSTASSARVKPLWRGVSHQVAAVAAVPLVALLISSAVSEIARAAALVYGASVLTLFVSSAVYHRPTWSPAVRAVLGRIDHAAIFLLIAGTYTPLCLLIGAGTGTWLLALVWGAAALGIIVAVAWDDAPKPVRAAIYVGLGWGFILVIPTIGAVIGGVALAFLVVGSVLYTLGALVFAIRRPDPAPAIFGFHEIFHLLVVAAAGCHFVVVAGVVRALG
jgi:hemolysin III